MKERLRPIYAQKPVFPHDKQRESKGLLKQLGTSLQLRQFPPQNPQYKSPRQPFEHSKQPRIPTQRQVSRRPFTSKRGVGYARREYGRGHRPVFLGGFETGNNGWKVGFEKRGGWEFEFGVCREV